MAEAREITEPNPPKSVTMEQYRVALRDFDGAVCEALAVGQVSSGRLEAPHVGYGTIIFARICAHATSFIRAAPKSRWTHSESENWDFAAVSGHARSIIEGYLLFIYISKNPESDEEWSARLNVMHLNDCMRRVRVLDGLSNPDEIQKFAEQAEELRQRLHDNAWFNDLDKKLQKRLLTGDYLTISTRDEQLDELGWSRREFYSLWHVLSQYTHILPFSFYRMEPNGRGTGIENDFDRTYTFMVLIQCTAILNECVDWMIEMFPDVAEARQGLNSKFSPGPRRNLPKHKKRKR